MWNKSKKQIGSFPQVKQDLEKPDIAPDIIIASNGVKSDQSITPIKTNIVPPVPIPIFDDCDIIILKTGEEIKCHVSEIGLHEIKYKKCDNPSGPTISVSKSDVFMIKYPNGTKDVIVNVKKEEEQKISSRPTGTDERVMNGFALAGFILSLVSFIGFVSIYVGFILGIAAIIFASIALYQIKRNKEKYKGKGLAIAALVISIIATVYWMVLINLAI
jgi:hypothetical protein